VSLNEPPSALERLEALERLPGVRSRAARRRRWRAAALAGAVLMVVAAGVVPASLLAFRGGSPTTQVQVGSNPGSTTAPSTRSPTTSAASSVPSTTAPAATSPPASSASGPAGGPVPPGFAAASVTFVSDSEGFVLGTAPCTSAPCTSILRTKDGGATWVGIPAPRAPLAEPGTTQGAISELRFADPSDGFAFGTGLWTTHDGGAQWTELGSVAGLSPYDVSDLVATSSGVYAVVSPWSTNPGTSTDTVLVRGNASGDSFSVIHNFGANVEVTQMVASGGVVYALVGNVGTRSLSLVRAAGSVVTTTPVLVSGLNGSPIDYCDYLAASSVTDLLLECGMGVADGSQGFRQLYGTTDSGQSWTAMSDPGTGAGTDTWGIADGGGGHAVIATGGGLSSGLLATTNFAQSWSDVLDVPTQNLGGWGDLGFEDSTHGVVIYAPGGPLNAGTAGSSPAGSGVLYRTTDGGASWSAVMF
jgi:hypothetical protein